MYITYIIAAIFAVLSVFLLTGHGAFLISGYNTAKAQKKALFDEKKLCRVTGAGLVVITISIFLKAAIPSFPIWLNLIMILGAVMFILIAGNLWCKNPTAATYPEKSNTPIRLLGGLVIIACVVALSFIGSISVQFQDTQLELKATLTGKSVIPYDEIEEIEFTDHLDLGARVGGIGNGVIQAGHFENKTFGKYDLYSYNKTTSYIIVHSKTKTYVFNGKSKQATKELYESLSSHVKATP